MLPVRREKHKKAEKCFKEYFSFLWNKNLFRIIWLWHHEIGERTVFYVEKRRNNILKHRLSGQSAFKKSENAL